ncbi:reverse transcriptase [Gossypium australe]|uniref:Reverse transcriptase n=1 Tax=Gossypium australe TaxID=47621 RepID=A0A5B6VA38_9ROSI|nr:reverse transcriptase [Gossypium australe]
MIIEVIGKKYSEEEVWVALKSIGLTKASGDDGLPALFFQRCWHIVGWDVVAYCLNILNEGVNFNPLNITNIVLIPKIPHPMNLENFRSISLCNVLYKLVAKMIINRFREVLESCIDNAQSSFVPGRLVLYNVLLAYEILHTLHHKKVGKKGSMAVKLDMSKAYDTVEWDFLWAMILDLGNYEVDFFSVIFDHIKWEGGEVFKPSRGLRQGDSLSPFLFLICSEGLSALMRLATRDGLMRGAKASRSGPQISHLLFADDCILFGEVNANEALVLKLILREYERCSGQRVNYDKSTIFFSTNTLNGDHRLCPAY